MVQELHFVRRSIEKTPMLVRSYVTPSPTFGRNFKVPSAPHPIRCLIVSKQTFADEPPSALHSQLIIHQPNQIERKLFIYFLYRVSCLLINKYPLIVSEGLINYHSESTATNSKVYLDQFFIFVPFGGSEKKMSD